MISLVRGFALPAKASQDHIKANEILDSEPRSFL